MKLTPERAIELRKRGIKVDSSKIIRAEKDPIVEVKTDSIAFDPIPQLINLAKVSENNTNKIIEVLNEITKPKAKRKYVSIVHRDRNGNINQVDTDEL